MKENNALVSITLAQLARKKGFDETCDFGYCFDVNKQGYYTNYDPNYFKNSSLWEKHVAAPTREQLQKWLRDRNVFVTIELDRTYEPKFVYSVDLYKEGGNWDKNLNKYSDLYYTYEQALEDGLLEGLNKV